MNRLTGGRRPGERTNEVQRYVLTLRCADRPGIVRALADGVVAAQGNIVENAQFSDPTTGMFAMRTCFESPLADVADVRAAIAGAVAGFGAELMVRPEEQRRRALVMVSKFDHCLVDLLYRWQIGELPVDIPLVVSNHPDLAPLAARHGIPFVHLPVTPASKPAAEDKLLALIDEHQIDVVVLARYMQVLSDAFCTRLPGRIINIHHSFLPGFKGAKPYHQAYERGVKIIGATAHYVTGDLDEGPIIEQDVVHVGHAQTAEDLVALGRDVERTVLARAVRLHAEDRLALNGSRTIVFR
jgi:formyltetrahydrofolate deformylase